MRIKYRIYGMTVCLIIIIFSFLIGSYYPDTEKPAYLLMMFAAGYALRESLERNKGFADITERGGPTDERGTIGG